MRISDWSSDVCSSDLHRGREEQANERCQRAVAGAAAAGRLGRHIRDRAHVGPDRRQDPACAVALAEPLLGFHALRHRERAHDRSEERSVGTEGVSPCSYRWSPYHKKKKTKKKT